MKKNSGVRLWTEDRVIPTYLPHVPDKNPMFLENRVYQGSSGKVYPLPFTDRIAETRTARKWKAVWIENEYLRVLVLPEIGGRIHRMQDKTNGYDLIYYQPVIKPALVGLAGPWISGGIEFNWPQHHRPATFLPVDFEVEHHPDGSKTIWCSDHDPMARMKGMHGVCLHPGQAYVELKARIYNRTPLIQTFLWWANVATRVHEAYQSFFPPDVHGVADHAKRATSEYPHCTGFYYGVNYGERGRHGVPANEVPNQFVPPHCWPRRKMGSQARPENALPPFRLPTSDFSYFPNDLSFYANIPVPTSYMCLGSQGDFFGGYDHLAQAGLVHYANHHLSPGKKQWTWGNHEFGYAWDRNLTDPDARGGHGPYIELMAGVYTDNQPDFSFLQPGETKTWNQYWYPIQKIGPAEHANREAAVHLGVAQNKVRLGIAVTTAQPSARVVITAKGKPLARFTQDLSPAKPLVQEFKLPRGIAETNLLIRFTDATGRELISYQPGKRVQGKVHPPATEPPGPADIASADELYVTGLHLEQYRHATRSPTLYWREALRRDPLDSRCNNALGLWHLRRGEFADAEKHFRLAIERLTRRNPNPLDGEAFYNLGLCLRFRSSRGNEALTPKGKRRQRVAPQATGDDEAYAAFYKATWSQAWARAGYHALAELDCCRGDWVKALEHLNHSLRLDTDNLRARNLKTLVLQKTGRHTEAAKLLRETLALDRLDWWARHLKGEVLTCDLQTCLDAAHDYARAGFFEAAIHLLEARLRSSGADPVSAVALPDRSWGALPLVHYTLGWLSEKMREPRKALKHFRSAAACPTDYCFPARLEEIAILECALHANPKDPRAPYYLGNLFYDRRRHEEAIQLWERAAKLDREFPTVWRNLGIAWFNIRHNVDKARTAYDRAFRLDPADARLLYERDQLWKRLRVKPAKRLRELERHLHLVRQRDDLSVELCALYNQMGRHDQALALVRSRQFQPWEGGEGGPLGQHVRSHLALGRAALASGKAAHAYEHFGAAAESPRNLGEARHLLANQSDIHFWTGCALAASGDTAQARQHWRTAARFKGDFQEMSVRAFSEMTFYSAMSWRQLGQPAKARQLLGDLLAHAKKLQNSPAKIDYFATSLPTMLLFQDDLPFRQQTTALFLQAQARLGMGDEKNALRLLRSVLQRDPSHAGAADLLVDLNSSIKPYS